MSAATAGHAEDARAIRALIRDVPNFPKPGIIYKDITPLLGDRSGFGAAIRAMARQVERESIHLVAAPEARGFIFGAALAQELGCGFVPIRKPGKLPYKTVTVDYKLEYGNDAVAMHVDAVQPGDRVLLVDDVLATGGTMNACTSLIAGRGGTITSILFLLELGFLEGRARLKDHIVRSLIVE
ncbi:MAG: adenine phosphoribosyltransferase [Planctomycetes bacterium]|nr:adenine phosphoribosyltransferase [Planctomycetota bacterium]